MTMSYIHINSILNSRINKYFFSNVPGICNPRVISTIAYCIVSINLYSQTNLNKNDNGLPAVHPLYTALASSMQHDAAVNSLKRQQWMNATINRLTAYQKSSMEQTIAADESDTDDFYRMSYRINGQGLIQFKDGSWVYIVSNSMHNDDEVGDLTVAIDNKGNKYINKGHVCGGIIHFDIKAKASVTTSDQFFKYFKSDMDDQSWMNLSGNYTSYFYNKDDQP